MAKEAKSICFEPPAQVVVGWIRADSECQAGALRVMSHQRVKVKVQLPGGEMGCFVSNMWNM